VVAASLAEKASLAAESLGEIARIAPLAIGGSGTSASLAEQIGARHLAADPLSAAALVLA